MKKIIIIGMCMFLLLLSLVSATELTVNGTNSDGVIRLSDITTNWDTVHDSSSGAIYDVSSTTATGAILSGKVSGRFTTTSIGRVFFYFNTSIIPDTATINNVSINVYGATNADSSVSFQEGTQSDPFTTDDFDNSNPTPATGGGEYGHVSWSTTWNKVNFNALGISNLNKTGITKIMGREYEHDYLDVDTGITSYYNGVTFSDSATNKPYLNVTYTAGATDTCTYGGTGNWSIDLSDYCVINTNYDLGSNSIVYTNTGNVTFNSNINVTDFPEPATSQDVFIGADAYILVS